MEVTLSEFNFSSFNFSSWMAEWQTIEVSSSEFNFDNWMAEWQTILGLVFILSWPCLFCIFFLVVTCCTGCLTVCCFKEDEWGKAEHFLDHLLHSKALLHLWMYFGLYLLIYGSLKHSPGVAVQVAVLHTLITALLQLGRLCSDKKKPPTYGSYQATANENKYEASNQDQEGKLVPVSVYSDFEGCTILECTSVFAFQIVLYGMLLSSVYYQERIDPEEIGERQVWSYIGGAAIGSVMRLTGNSFENNEWIPFWDLYFKDFRREEHWTRLRFTMSWMVNHFLADFTLLMLPIILMQAEDNMDFVKDATSVLFISELDDISNVTEIVRPSKQPSGQGEQLKPSPQKIGKFASASE